MKPETTRGKLDLSSNGRTRPPCSPGGCGCFGRAVRDVGGRGERGGRGGEVAPRKLDPNGPPRPRRRHHRPPWWEGAQGGLLARRGPPVQQRAVPHDGGHHV